ncbi:MAG: hypothetical protein GXZ08_06275 [Tissierellia bacterium]|nr:hypothetical protein [Tissierellia bacterium]
MTKTMHKFIRSISFILAFAILLVTPLEAFAQVQHVLEENMENVQNQNNEVPNEMGSNEEVIVPEGKDSEPKFIEESLEERQAKIEMTTYSQSGEVKVGEKITINTEIRNIGEEVARNLYLNFNTPDGFEFVHSNYSNEPRSSKVVIRDINPGETVQIELTFKVLDATGVTIVQFSNTLLGDNVESISSTTTVEVTKENLKRVKTGPYPGATTGEVSFTYGDENPLVDLSEAIQESIDANESEVSPRMTLFSNKISLDIQFDISFEPLAGSPYTLEDYLEENL